MSVVPVQEMVRRRMREKSIAEIADELGVASRQVSRVLYNDRFFKPNFSIGVAERWADRFKLHPFDIWGDVYWRHATRVAA